MSNFPGQHPDAGVLLQYLDGELRGRKAHRVRRHLEACWQCRTEMEELRNTVADCVRYRKNVLAAHLPEPPAPWGDLSRGFDRIDAEMAAESWMARFGRFLGTPAVRRWAVSATAVCLAVTAVWFQFRQTPSVQAAALLHRAVVQAEAHPKAHRRIEVRTRTRRFTMPDRTAAPVVQAMFDAARYDSQDPLSAKSFEQWRNSVAQKTDEVATVADCYRIRTTAAEGYLAVASLTLRTADLSPVEGRFEFRDHEWVELTDITEASTRDDAVAVAPHIEAPMRPGVPSRPAATPSGSSVPISEELQVLAALHEIGADLGDPVNVTVADGHVVVSGVGVPAKRQRDIHRVLDPLPGVEIRFSEPSLPAVPDDAPATEPRTQAARPGSGQKYLEQQLGGRAEFERFSSQMLDWNEAAMARAYALRALAQRFPAASEAGLNARDRQVLIDMARQHLDVLVAQLAELQRALGPVLPAAPPAQHAAAATWQNSTENVFRSARRVEVLLSALLGVAPSDTDPGRVPADLSATLAQLRAEVQQLQSVLQSAH